MSETIIHEISMRNETMREPIVINAEKLLYC